MDFYAWQQCISLETPREFGGVRTASAYIKTICVRLLKLSMIKMQVSVLNYAVTLIFGGSLRYFTVTGFYPVPLAATHTARVSVHISVPGLREAYSFRP